MNVDKITNLIASLPHPCYIKGSIEDLKSIVSEYSERIVKSYGVDIDELAKLQDLLCVLDHLHAIANVTPLLREEAGIDSPTLNPAEHNA